VTWRTQLEYVRQREQGAAGDGRGKLHTEEVCSLYFSPDIRGQSEMDKMLGAWSTRGEMRNAYKILVGNPEGKGPLWRPSCRWMNISTRMLGKQVGTVWIGFVWLTVRTGGGLFWTRQWTSRLGNFVQYWVHYTVRMLHCTYCYQQMTCFSLSFLPFSIICFPPTLLFFSTCESWEPG
jgi:hypothetical protein